MRTNTDRPLQFVVVMAVASSASAWAQQPLGTAFSYQGRLEQSGQPYSGPADLVFEMYGLPAGGSPVGLPQSLNGWPVVDGLFTVALNDNASFGPRAFNGEARWLQVTANGQVLSPRQPILAAPYALHLPHGTIEVINVRDFGAYGRYDCSDPTCTTDECNDTLALQAAADAIPDEGGILYFPPGRYCVRGDIISLKSRTWVLGSGRASVVARSLGIISGGPLLKATGADDITISNMTFDVMRVASSTQGVAFVPAAPDSNDPNDPIDYCTNIVIESCHFYTSIAPSLDDTLAAVEAQRVRGLRVTNCTFDQVQVRAANAGDSEGLGGGGPGVIVAGNHFRDSYKYAVSFVARQVSGADPIDDLSDALIANNVIVNPHDGGIFVGTDSDAGFEPARTCKRIVIRGNVISGFGPQRADGILMTMAVDSEDWVVDGNILDMGQFPDSVGIRVRPLDPGFAETRLRGLVISNNTVRGTVNYPGIWIAGSVQGFSISGNHLDVRDTSAILIGSLTECAPVIGATRDGAIVENVAYGGGLALQAVQSDVGPVLVRGNVFNACDPDGNNCLSTGILLKTCGSEYSVAADVLGNRCRGGQYGIREIGDVGTNFDTRYLENDVRGYGVLGMTVINPTAIVRNNAGWVTENCGQGAIAAPSTNTIVTHGLSVTPPLGAISITPLTGHPTESSGQGAIATSSTSTMVAHGLSGTPALGAISIIPLAGHPTELSGQSAIGASGSVVVEHGLSAIPHSGSIGITAMNDPGVDPGHIWVSDVNETSFTVHCANPPPIGQLEFGWRIVRVDPGSIWVSDVNGTTFTVNCVNPPRAGPVDFEWRIVVDPGSIWVSDVNGTTFTVNCVNPPLSGQLDFGWKIVLGQN